MARKVNKLALKRGELPIRPIDYTINENGCWIWNWPVSQKGYASVKVGGRTYKAHRLSYEMVYGSIPAGHLIRHLCGNPSCVKPEHLRTGTQTENSRDMVAAGNQHHQKLTRDDAAKIRHLITKGNISQVELAKIYNVNPSNISQIISNKTFYDPEYMPPPKYSTRRGGKSREFLVQGEDDENARLPL